MTPSTTRETAPPATEQANSNETDTRPPAVEVCGLGKTFGETRAVDGIDLTVPRGGIFGLLGPNGAGKTTAIRMLATLLAPDAGTARVLGYDVSEDPGEIRRRVSLTGQFASVDEDLTGRENLVLLARLEGYSRRGARNRATELLDAFGLTEAARKQVSAYSGGMRRRLDIAASIVVTPELLFLDEPTTGLDPRNRNQVWEIIRALVDDGTTVVLTTQYLEEADQLADRIAVIDDGEIIAEGTPGDLKAAVGSGVLTIAVTDPAQRDRAIERLSERVDDLVAAGSDPRTLTARVTEPAIALDAFAALSEASIDVTEFSLGQPSLDEVFLALTDRPTAQSCRGVDLPDGGESR